ncbi:MAG: hypothetical protein OEX81_05795 [Candidatus Pacebacteria bacterium]|nr:hypothetical protein [Candidatus Paceibacterota bacterium]
MLINKTKQQAGLSVIEIIIATAIFIIMASSSMATILGSFSTSRLGSERAQADFLAIEGVEAIESIRNQNWTNLSNGTYGLTQTAGVWSLSGTPDSDPSGKFTRTITISDVERDGNGDIIASGGTVDVETKLITSTINWNFTPTRSNSIQKELYLTNWQKSTSPGGGVTPPTPTPTPTPTVTPTPTPTPSPVPVDSCTTYCASLPAYSSGTCRANPNACNLNSQTHEAGGDSWCVGGPSADTCCCAI